MIKNARRRIGLAGLMFLLISVSISLSQRANANHTTFAPGDVFVALRTSGGEVQWRHADGTLNKIIIGQVPGPAAAVGFDSTGNLFVTRLCVEGNCQLGNTVEVFNNSGISQGTFGGGYNCNPHSIVFDNNGNAFVGQQDCSGDLLKFDSAGQLLAAFDVAIENLRGSTWIALAADGCTIFYTTSEGSNILRFDTCANAQLSNFNKQPLPGLAHQLRILPDGGVLVATEPLIVRLDSSGNVVQTFDVPDQPNLWMGLDIVGDGTFWVSNFLSSDVFRIDMATGAVVARFNTGTPPGTAKGIGVFRPAEVTPPAQEITRGRMTGGGSVFTDSGMRVTHGFELHCDASRKPNNLEINWHPKGQASSRFHLLNLTFARCTDDPNISPRPPVAPFDTYEGIGTGSFNGQPGATAEWIFTDAGEPGTKDRIRKLVIRDAGGNVVLSIEDPGKTLTFGNHQAHKN